MSEYYEFTDGQEGAKSTSNRSIPEMKIIPALGTHAPMTDPQIRSMYGDKLADKTPSPFIVHDWRKDVVTIGHAPADMVNEATDGMVNCEWPAQLNRCVRNENSKITFCFIIPAMSDP